MKWERKHRLKPETIEKQERMKAMKLRGMKLHEIARVEGVSMQQVSYLLKGISRRARGEEPRSYVSSDGSTYIGIDNIAKFCEEHGLKEESMRLLWRRKIQHHRGFRRYPLEFEPGMLKLVDKAGTVYEVNELFLYKFCEEHGIDQSRLGHVLSGTHKSYKGWSLYQEPKEKPQPEPTVEPVQKTSDTEAFARGMKKFYVDPRILSPSVVLSDRLEEYKLDAPAKPMGVWREDELISRFGRKERKVYGRRKAV